MRVLIADDHDLIRRGLRQILTDELEIQRIDEAKDGWEVLEKVNTEKYDILILDISMPGKSGIDILKELKKVSPIPSVLVLSIHPEEQYALRVMKEGASGFLNKGGASEELVRAIRQIAAGNRYITPTISEQLLQDFDQKEEPLYHRLSTREYQVMLLLASGKTVKEISETLFLSVKTISTYRSRVLDKLNLENNARLMQYAVKHHLIET